MCFSPPKLNPLPRPPAADDPAVVRRQELEAARLAAQGGSANTVKTDLDPKGLGGGKRVLLGV